jgi:hypothetical protein
MDVQHAEADDGTADVRVRWMAPPKLPRFGGELTDGPVEDFIDEATRVMQAYNLQGKMGVEYVLRHLDGIARREALASRHEDPAALLTALQTAFGDARSVMTLLSVFHSRQQRAEERLIQYAHNIQDLACRINSKQADTLSAKAIRDRFVEGLSNGALKRDLQRMVRNDDNVTLAALRTEATEWLRHETHDATVQRQYRSQPQDSTSATKIDRLTEQVTALTANLQTMQAAMLTLSEQVKGQNSSQQNRPPPVRKCFKCKKPGHIARNCPEND